VPADREAQHAVRNASTSRPCLRAVCAIVITGSAKRSPRSLWLPNERRRQSTKLRSSRSAWLFVGSMPSRSTKVHSASRCSRMSSHEPESPFTSLAARDAGCAVSHKYVAFADVHYALVLMRAGLREEARRMLDSLPRYAFSDPMPDARVQRELGPSLVRGVIWLEQGRTSDAERALSCARDGAQRAGGSHAQRDRSTRRRRRRGTACRARGVPHHAPRESLGSRARLKRSAARRRHAAVLRGASIHSRSCAHARWARTRTVP
jgi:hypothetical protein